MLESIKCSAGGAYYLRGQWVQADADAPAALAAQGVDAAAAAEAYKGTDRKSTRLNSSHSSQSRMPSSA